MAIANYSKSCSQNTPGNVFLAFSEVDNIDTVTISGGEITALTMDGVTKFHEFDSELDGIKVMMEGTGGSNFFQTNKIEAKFAKLTKELITAKQSLVDAMVCGLAAIFIDGNGQAWLAGYNDTEKKRRPLNKITANFDSGNKPSDEGLAQYTITCEGESALDVVPFDSTLTAAIVGETSTFIEYNT